MPNKIRLLPQRGFTLLALMFVVAVVGILSAIAMPSYTEYIRRGHRADAKAGLLQAQQWLERAATATGNYPGSLAPSLTWSTDNSKRYLISYTATTTADGNVTGYTLTATRRGAQTGDRCGNFTLTHTGAQNIAAAAAGVTKAECWGK